MSNFKLVSVSNQVIYQKILNEKDFCFMSFLKDFSKDTGMDESILDIKKSISLINRENNMSLQTILHVEDESILRDLTDTFGEKAGHYIKSVSSSEDAEKLIVQNPNLFSVVLLDKHLPGLDGDKFGLKLKSFSPGVQVCIVTGDPDSLDKKITNKGIDRVIKKPLSYDIFCNTIGSKSKKVA